MKRKGSKPMI